MKFNKIVALALALVMVFALCACGGGTDTKKDDSNSAAKVDTNTVSVGAVSSRATTFRPIKSMRSCPPSSTTSMPSLLSTARAQS